ncbi:bifunctional molybdenum cofactor biosynthesis protein MoaC/MoaB [Phycisphaera mikurensis]|uniref:Molybdopterin adenylyltransferase n=1 Tax=Phycisphaera mikurensis (strain NBRC 102666 / KCTC 22515 / FYK2301M01) TaxID=1142394 RepID=I0IG02_PHYMF|nr:bifunctional molybdenum cofactor biosynthesis protein MoaC/MoaB [Phycisphaera mikurensis]MBB6440424.1 cyclic pyranopterin phosphate synthase [Phycisphaera mikurensis]BAM04190.1 molybdenum cofactor biosynthesis bifunctional protein MoaCB [Phycisphaera mikurensis NBRC 102666]
MPETDQERGFTHTGPGGVRMVDAGGKPLTPRSATVRAVVAVGPALARAISANEVSKGDVLGTAQLAGIAAAKRTADLIPLCHPLPIDGVEVTLALDEPAGEVGIEATVTTVWKTGVEMEAFTCATAAALTVIDMGKAIERDCRIQEVRLLAKSGGRSGDFGTAEREPEAAEAATVRGSGSASAEVAVLTVSDGVAAGEREDLGGPAVASAAERMLGAGAVVRTASTADGREAVERALRDLLAEEPDLLLTTGGTGLAARDLTPEATAAVVDRPAPALMELARARCCASFPLAVLSRGIAGVAGPTLVVNLPGSPKGAVETLEALADVLPHAIATLQGPAAAASHPGHGRV